MLTTKPHYNTDVNPETINHLLNLNREFYQTFALQFSQTRQRIQPGVCRLVEQIPSQSRILDLGCGNGALWLYLNKIGYQGRYIGIDSSPELLKIARAAVPAQTKIGPLFVDLDLTSPNWIQNLIEECFKTDLEGTPLSFDVILAFAVLHHIPSDHLRKQIMENVHSLIADNGTFFHSEWQFLNSQRLRNRIQSWSLAGLELSDVEDGDYLLDWRHGGMGLRYVHQFTEKELTMLAEETHFTICETFYSDGQNSNTGLYQVWRRKDQTPGEQ